MPRRPPAASTTTIPSLVEVAEGAARLVDPYWVEAIAEAMHALLTDAGERARLSAAGLERARQYSWADTARRTIETYRLALMPGSDP